MKKTNKQKIPNIRRKDDGTYEWRKMINGKRYSLSDKDKQRLQRRARKFEEEMSFTQRRRTSDVTLDEIYEIWIRTKKNTLKPITYTRYVSTYNVHIKPVFGNKLITDIKHSDVKNFYINMAIEGEKSRGTIEDMNSIFKMIMELAVNDELIMRNPCINATDEAKKIARQPKQKFAMSDEQIESLMEFVKNSKTYNRWYGIILFALSTGMRINEITALQNSDIDLENEMITVNKTLSCYPDWDNDEHKQIYAIQTPKNRTSDRKIPITDNVREAIVFERERCKNQNIVCESKVEGGVGFKGQTFNDFLFLNNIGEHYKEGCVCKGFSRIVKAYNKKAQEENLPHITPHIARHTLITKMMQSDMNQLVTISISGHATTHHTITTYTHVQDDFLKQNMKMFEESEGKKN